MNLTKAEFVAVEHVKKTFSELRSAMNELQNTATSTRFVFRINTHDTHGASVARNAIDIPFNLDGPGMTLSVLYDL